MPVEYIRAITQRYERLGYTPYRWFEAAVAPAAQALGKPLAETRLGLLSTAGIYGLGQVAFHFMEDTSVRRIPLQVPDRDLRFAHPASIYLYDTYDDPNCVFPRRTLKRLVAEGFLGEVASETLTCMGAIYSTRRVREELAPRVLEAFRAQGADAALLVAM